MTNEEKDLLFLDALRAAGVDNWEGYDDALTIYHEMLEELDDQASDNS